MNNLLSQNDNERLTKTGKILRKYSIDEIPQLFNILKGEMSFIGPRPLLPEYLPLYAENQAKRHTVKPGITGLAQIKGRNTLSWKHKFRYDTFYVQHVSLQLDTYILYKTFENLFLAKKINEAAVLTEKFNGKN